MTDLRKCHARPRLRSMERGARSGPHGNSFIADDAGEGMSSNATSRRSGGLLDALDCSPWALPQAARGVPRAMPGRSTPRRSASAGTIRHGPWCRACWRRCSSRSSSSASAWSCASCRRARAWPPRPVGRGQDLRALRDHDHRCDLGEGGLRPVSVCAGLLLGGRRSACWSWHCTPPISSALVTGCADARAADAARAGRLCHLRLQRRPVPAEAAGGAPRRDQWPSAATRRPAARELAE